MSDKINNILIFVSIIELLFMEDSMVQKIPEVRRGAV